MLTFSSPCSVGRRGVKGSLRKHFCQESNFFSCADNNSTTPKPSFAGNECDDYSTSATKPYATARSENVDNPCRADDKTTVSQQAKTPPLTHLPWPAASDTHPLAFFYQPLLLMCLMWCQTTLTPQHTEPHTGSAHTHKHTQHTRTICTTYACQYSCLHICHSCRK